MELENECVFCQANETSDTNVICSNETMIAIRDKYPVTRGHTLVIPRQHRGDFFDLSKEESSDLIELLHELKQKIIDEDSSVRGFNVGANCGAEAGQTVFHCHVHLVPRRPGDSDDPTGGVRGVIPHKQKY